MSGTVKAKQPSPAPASMPDPSEPSGPQAIRARGLGRRFGRRWVVRNLDLAVPHGSVTALLGRNGVGKSTTIQLLLGLLPASEGSVEILGLDPRRERTAVFREVAYVSERRELLEDQTVAGLAAIVADIHGRRFDRARFEELRARYALAPDARCRTLSKGQRARVLLALALATAPKLLVLDEPTSGLDVVVRDDFLEGIADFAAEEERSVLLSTHLIDDVARIADRAIIIRDGRPPLIGDLEDLRRTCNRYLVRLSGVVEPAARVPLPEGAVITERDPRLLTVISPGAPEHLEAALDAALPLAGIERQAATLKEAFTCLSAPAREEVRS